MLYPSFPLLMFISWIKEFCLHELVSERNCLLVILVTIKRQFKKNPSVLKAISLPLGKGN